ncbi:MAG: site-2 protease family protein, partial [Oscillospiraceae bacterium]
MAFKILIALLVFGFIIFIHELGHFVAARWAKVKV